MTTTAASIGPWPAKRKRTIAAPTIPPPVHLCTYETAPPASQLIRCVDAAASLAAIYGRPPPPAAEAAAPPPAPPSQQQQQQPQQPRRPGSAGNKRGAAAAAGEGTEAAAAATRPRRYAADELERMTVKELQEMLRSKGLGATGRKDALVARLLDAQRRGGGG